MWFVYALAGIGALATCVILGCLGWLLTEPRDMDKGAPQ